MHCCKYGQISSGEILAMGAGAGARQGPCVCSHMFVLQYNIKGASYSELQSNWLKTMNVVFINLCCPIYYPPAICGYLNLTKIIQIKNSDPQTSHISSAQ